MDMKKIGNFLKTLRKEKGLTQEKLAEKLGVVSIAKVNKSFLLILGECTAFTVVSKRSLMGIYKPFT